VYEFTRNSRYFGYIIIIIMGGVPVKEHGSWLHDTPPGGTIGRTPTCCMEAKVKWLEISFDCS